MAIRGPRLEFSVGAFLLLALASLMVLAVASTNQRWSWGSEGYDLKARFSQVGQLRKQAPVKIGGVTVGQVASIDLDPVKFESIDDVYVDDQPWFASDEPNAFDQLAEGQQRERLIAAIAALPEREQLVIQLYHVEELNLDEIGEVLGVGAARVCQIKSAAHARLKKTLLRG